MDTRRNCSKSRRSNNESHQSGLAGDLAEYAGEYFSEELETGYRLAIADGELEFRVPGQAPEVLTAMFDAKFENPDYGSFTFGRDDDGAISGFLLQSRWVRNLHFGRQ